MTQRRGHTSHAQQLLSGHLGFCSDSDPGLPLHDSYPCVGGSPGPVEKALEAGEAGKGREGVGGGPAAPSRHPWASCVGQARAAPLAQLLGYEVVLSLPPAQECSGLGWGGRTQALGREWGSAPCGACLRGWQSGLLFLLLCHLAAGPCLPSGPRDLPACPTVKGQKPAGTVS